MNQNEYIFFLNLDAKADVIWKSLYSQYYTKNILFNQSGQKGGKLLNGSFKLRPLIDKIVLINNFVNRIYNQSLVNVYKLAFCFQVVKLINMA